MKVTEMYDAKAIAIQQTEAASNRQPYFGEGLFPAKKKMGLDLKWIKTHKGLPVSLAPSNFDAKSTLRSREGIKMDETQMAFFRESMLVKEEDEQNMMRVQESSDPYALEVLNHIYDDTNTLVEGARVVPERMRMQLLAPAADGSPRIVLEANGVQYSYNYDPDGAYKANNYTALTAAADKWTDSANSDPLDDVMTAQDAVEANAGSRPSIMLLSRKTMGYLKKNANIRSAILAQNTTANILMTDARVNELFQNELGITIVVYCDDSVKQIVLAEHEPDSEDKQDIDAVWKKITRHEIVHAFLSESGLAENSDWAQNEELVDWIAIQGPKIWKAWQEAGAV